MPKRAKKGLSGKKNSRDDSNRKKFIFKSILSFFILMILVLGAAWLARIFIPPLEIRKQPSQKTVAKSRAHKTKHYAQPRFEVFPKEEKPFSGTYAPPTVPVPSGKPMVAVIIDDLGYNRKIANKFLSLDAPITFSIFPHSPFQKSIAISAHRKGLEVMLHLPMEPLEYPRVNPGPGALLVSMDPDRLIRQLKDDLGCVPYIKGVNNHMGSKMTVISTQMYQIFSILKKRGLFFIDSRTTKDSLCRPSARLLGIKFAERNVFLDHVREKKSIHKQIKHLIQYALKHGRAVGIGHPYSMTYEALAEELPVIRKIVRLVPASLIVHAMGTKNVEGIVFGVHHTERRLKRITSKSLH